MRYVKYNAKDIGKEKDEYVPLKTQEEAEELQMRLRKKRGINVEICDEDKKPIKDPDATPAKKGGEKPIKDPDATPAKKGGK